jgi:DNA repair protein RecO (recombination protein O)
MTKTEKILVLRAFKHGESDLVVHGLNALGARLNFIAKGGLKSRKRFAGGILEPTHYIEVTYKVRGESGDSEPLHLLLEARLVREFSGLRTDYARLEAALYMLQLVHKLGQHGVVDAPELFNLLGNALQAAETSRHLENLKLQFELKLLAAQGVLPGHEAFTPWLKTGLAQHEELRSEGGERQWLVSQAHAHLRHYLGSIL